MVEEASELDLALLVSLNVVCFRYTRPDLDDAALDHLNKRIAAPSIVQHKRSIFMPQLQIIEAVGVILMFWCER